MKNYAEKIIMDENIYDPLLEVLEIIQKKCNHGDDTNLLSKSEK